MLIKIGRIKIDTESRVNKHKDYLYNSIRLLHQEIIDLVMDGETKNRLAIKELKSKAKLIKKYRRRLKLLAT
jgi:hypothetical protein|tara:strand:+ start:177 stop:392 length:216 start_codon:yes stop_codon:yes gene_type:complete